ncbi:MAG TPA: long-chain fatty acid--CoA ligase [Polyangiaceae bacterium]|nr:long-chain fatty acid--CoA ligase [Polyangiaceae bacterium]
MPADTIPARFLSQGNVRPHAPAYYVRTDGQWQMTTWRQRVERVQRIARSLMAFDVRAGNATAILGANRAEWVDWHLATMMVGATPAGIYTTCSSEQVRYIVEHSESPILLLDSEDQLRKVEREWARLPGLGHVVLMPSAPQRLADGARVLGWMAFLDRGAGIAQEKLDQRFAALSEEAAATVIYTSGTTGPPKAVLLSHKNLTFTADVAMSLVSLSSSDRLFSYLPLSHIAEQMFSIIGPACSGTPVYFARSTETIPDDLREVQPTVFFGVPRVWEKLAAVVAARIAGLRGPKARLLAWAMGVGRRAVAKRNADTPLGLRLSIERAVARKLVLGPALTKMGFGSARVCVTGAAPTPRAVLDFFAGLDLPLHEVYGQSEASGPTTFNVPGQTRYGTVGKVIPGVEVRLAEDGEILVRGANVFAGYAKDPAATRESFVDGWLCSGDLGSLDAAGFLRITGRKKEILITAGGKNITPSLIEEALKTIDLVADAVVIGDGRKFLVALLVLDPGRCEAYQAERADQAPAHESAALRAVLEAEVERVNARLGRVEQIKRFHILPRPFSLEAGELTPTLKVRRKAVNDNFASEIERLYAERQEETQRDVSHVG